MKYRIQRYLRRWDYSLVPPVDFQIDPDLKATWFDIDVPESMIARHIESVKAYNESQSELRDLFDKQSK